VGIQFDAILCVPGSVVDTFGGVEFGGSDTKRAGEKRTEVKAMPSSAELHPTKYWNQGT
jgi:hypothetical protein